MKTSLHGSCLCGSMKYRLEGHSQGFYHCHCQRCRKLSGTGHASNLLIREAHFEWLQGANLLRSYKVPEAKRFRNDFCSQCGSPMPRYVPEREAVVLPAGSLDCDAPEIPHSRIFMDSAAPWSCQDDTLPRFAEYEPR